MIDNEIKKHVVRLYLIVFKLYSSRNGIFIIIIANDIHSYLARKVTDLNNSLIWLKLRQKIGSHISREKFTLLKLRSRNTGWKKLKQWNRFT